LASSFFVNGLLEKVECKLFQPLSLRARIVLHYITINTASLTSFFAAKGTKAALLKCVTDNKVAF